MKLFELKKYNYNGHASGITTDIAVWTNCHIMKELN